MPRALKNLGIVWVRLGLTIILYALILGGVLLSYRGEGNNPLLTLVASNPSLVGTVVAFIFFLPGLATGLLHYLWSWLAFSANRGDRPDWINSTWEGCLSLMVFWGGLLAPTMLLLPFVPLPAPEAKTSIPDSLTGLAGTLTLITWHILYFLEMKVRNPAPPVSRPSPKPQAPPKPVDDLDRLKRKQAAQQRQQAIASANEWELAGKAKKSPAAPRRQAQSETTNPAPPREDPFGDANF